MQGSSWWEEPNARAERCLRDHLTPEQSTQYRQEGRLCVRGGQSGRLYWIVGFSVYCYDEAGLETFCAKPSGIYDLPDADHTLVLKLYIEANEEEFLWVANVCRFPPGHPAAVDFERYYVGRHFP